MFVCLQTNTAYTCINHVTLCMQSWNSHCSPRRRDVTCGRVLLSAQGRPSAPSSVQHSAAAPAPSISVPRAGRRSNVERSSAVMDLLLKPRTLCSQRSCRGRRRLRPPESNTHCAGRAHSGVRFWTPSAPEVLICVSRSVRQATKDSSTKTTYPTRCGTTKVCSPPVEPRPYTHTVIRCPRCFEDIKINEPRNLLQQ